MKKHNLMYGGQDTIIALEEEVARGGTVGLDIATGQPCDPATAGIYDNYLVKRQARRAYKLLFHQPSANPVPQSWRLRARDARHSGQATQRGNLAHPPCRQCMTVLGEQHWVHNLCL